MEVLLHSFLTSALDGDEQLASWPSKSASASHWTGGPQRQFECFWKEKNHMPLPEIQTMTPWPSKLRPNYNTKGVITAPPETMWRIKWTTANGTSVQWQVLHTATAPYTCGLAHFKKNSYSYFWMVHNRLLDSSGYVWDSVSAKDDRLVPLH